MTKKQTTCIGYMRVSKMGGRQEDDDATQTLKIQRQRIEGLAASRGWRIVGWYQDLDASGGDLDRPQFQLALDAVGTGRDADVFACAFLDRFSRDEVDTILTERQIREAGGSLVVTDVDIDTSTPTGRLIFGFFASMNQYFRDTKRDQLNETRERAVNRGIAPSRTPLGYRKIDRPGTPEHRRYEIVEDEADAVRLAFQLRADGATCPEIARQLNAHGYRSRRGAQFTHRGVRTMLDVKTYTGDVVDGDYVYPDAHPAIVSRDLWRRAQTETKPAAARSNPSLLAGVVRCASCSHAMVVSGSRADGKLYYRCRGVYATGRCPAPASVKMEILDDHVERDFLATADQHLGRVVESDPTDSDDLAAAVEAAQLELDTFMDEAQISVLGADRWNRQVAKLTAILEAAQDAVRRSQRSALPHVGFRAVGDVWSTLATTEKREVLHATLDAVFVKPAPRSHASADPADRTYVAPRGSVDVDLPRRGVLGTIARFVFPDVAPAPVGMLAA